MKHDPKTSLIATVDVARAGLKKPENLGIDFYNEIDVWAKMQFRARQQVQRLRAQGSLDGHHTIQDLTTLYYALREKLD